MATKFNHILKGSYNTAKDLYNKPEFQTFIRHAAVGGLHCTGINEYAEAFAGYQDGNYKHALLHGAIGAAAFGTSGLLLPPPQYLFTGLSKLKKASADSYALKKASEKSFALKKAVEERFAFEKAVKDSVKFTVESKRFKMSFELHRKAADDQWNRLDNTHSLYK